MPKMAEQAEPDQDRIRAQVVARASQIRAELDAMVNQSDGANEEKERREMMSTNRWIYGIAVTYLDASLIERYRDALLFNTIANDRTAKDIVERRNARRAMYRAVRDAIRARRGLDYIREVVDRLGRPSAWRNPEQQPSEAKHANSTHLPAKLGQEEEE